MYQSVDYDMPFPHLAYPIGIKSTFPEELIRRVIAAAISFQAGNKGIDYTYKQYVKNKQYQTNDGSRLDIRIAASISECGNQLSALIYHITTGDEKIIGNIISEWTIMRIPHSLRQLTSMAQRGNLYECCAVARMLLEQLAWAAAIDNLENPESIHKVKAESRIPALKKKLEFAGNLYGWLSSHSHWRYDGHIKAMTFAEDRMATMLRSSRFKAIALTIALLILSSTVHILHKLRTKEISAILLMPLDSTIDSQQLSRKLTDNRESLIARLRPTVADIRALLTLSEPLALIDEIRSLFGFDADIEKLSCMVEDLREVGRIV